MLEDAKLGSECRPRIGDRVRCVNDGGFGDIVNGRTYTVGGVSGDQISLDGISCMGYLWQNSFWSSWRFVPAEPEAEQRDFRSLAGELAAALREASSVLQGLATCHCGHSFVCTPCMMVREIGAALAKWEAAGVG